VSAGQALVAPRVEQPFYGAGILKLVLLSVSTFNLYLLVWLLLHWRHRRDITGERVIPSVRSLFFPWVFTVPLGYRVAKAGVRLGACGWASPLVAATLWVVVTLSTVVLPEGPALLLALTAVGPAVWLQVLANRVNACVVPNYDRNDQLTTSNEVVVAVGGLLLLLAIIGLFTHGASVSVEERF
jgi:hypothetical protein